MISLNTVQSNIEWDTYSERSYWLDFFFFLSISKADFLISINNACFSNSFICQYKAFTMVNQYPQSTESHQQHRFAWHTPPEYLVWHRPMREQITKEWANSHSANENTEYFLVFWLWHNFWTLKLMMYNTTPLLITVAKHWNSSSGGEVDLPNPRRD